MGEILEVEIPTPGGIAVKDMSMDKKGEEVGLEQCTPQPLPDEGHLVEERGISNG